MEVIAAPDSAFGILLGVVVPKSLISKGRFLRFSVFGINVVYEGPQLMAAFGRWHSIYSVTFSAKTTHKTLEIAPRAKQANPRNRGESEKESC
jgi:hypothetical protein